MAGVANEAKKAANIVNAGKAEAYYGAGEYEKALEVLHLIEGNLNDKEDPRFLHNLRLVETAAGGFTNIKGLREGLREIKTKVRAKQLAKLSTTSASSSTDEKNNSSTAAAAAAGGAASSSSGAAAAAANNGSSDKAGGAVAASSSSSSAPLVLMANTTAATDSSASSSSLAVDVEVAETLAVLADADSDCSILLYNLAALHFERHEYGAARSILEHLFRDIEPIEETVAVYVCLLLLDVLVHCSRGALLTSEDRHSFAQQTEEVLGKMEKLAVSGSSTGGGEGGNEGGNKDSSSSSSGAEASSSSSSSSASPPFSPEQAADLEFRVHLYRAKALLMQQHLKASKKEIKTALEILQKSKFNLSATTPSSSSSSSSSGGSEWGSSAPALRNMSALYLKANFEYLRQNYRKALKLLSSCHTTGQMLQQLEGPDATNTQAAASSTTPTAVAMKGAVGAMYFNNVACVHHKMRRFHLALHYFQKALAECSSSSGTGGAGAAAASSSSSSSSSSGGGSSGGGSGKKKKQQQQQIQQQQSEGVGGGVVGTGMSKDGRPRTGVECEVRYNAGLQLLLAGGKPEGALELFEGAAHLLHGRPTLWLRMAECCLQAYCSSSSSSSSGGGGGGGEGRRKQQQEKDGEVGSLQLLSSGEKGWEVVGSGGQRRFLLPAGGGGNGLLCIPDGDNSEGSAGAGTPANNNGGGGGGRCSLSYASACLRNALFLLAAQAAAKKKKEVEGKLGGLFGTTGAGAGGGGGGGAQGGSGAGGGGGGGGGKKGDGSQAAGGGGGGGGADVGEGSTGGGDTVSVEAACLLNLAFVHLCLGEPQLALHFASRLLRLGAPQQPSTAAGAAAAAGANSSSSGGGGGGTPSSPPTSWSSSAGASPPHTVALAHMYAAEALCALNKPSEALDHLVQGSGRGDGGDSGDSAAAAAAAGTAPQPPPAEAVDAWAGALADSAHPTSSFSSSGKSNSSASAAKSAAAEVVVVASHDKSQVKAAMYANLAAAFLAQHQQLGGGVTSAAGAAAAAAAGGSGAVAASAAGAALQQAEKCARLAVGACPGSPHARRLLVVALLKAGKAAEALEWLKLYRTASSGDGTGG